MSLRYSEQMESFIQVTCLALRPFRETAIIPTNHSVGPNSPALQNAPDGSRIACHAVAEGRIPVPLFP